MTRRKLLLSITLTICFALITLTCTACSSSGSRGINLEKQVCTNEILNYQLDDGTTITSKVQSFEVLSSKTVDKHDSSEVKVVLKDSLLERTLYISTESTKYDQGWQIDSLYVTQSSFNLIGEIDQNYIVSNLSQNKEDNYGQGNVSNYRVLNGTAVGFKNLKKTSSSIEDNSFYAVYEVNDSHQYADVSGTIYVRVDLSISTDPYSGASYVKRSFSSDTEAITTNWHDIYGTYKLSVPYSTNQLEQYITVDSSQAVSGYREWIGANDNQKYHEDLTGTFDVVSYSTAIVCVVDSWHHSYYIIFTPDEIRYRYLMPNGSDFDTGDNFNKVFYERIN